MSEKHNKSGEYHKKMSGWKLAWILTPTISFAIGLLLGFKDARHYRRGWIKDLLGRRSPLDDTWDTVLNGFEWAFVFAAIASIILMIVFFDLKARKRRSKRDNK